MDERKLLTGPRMGLACFHSQCVRLYTLMPGGTSAYRPWRHFVLLLIAMTGITGTGQVHALTAEPGIQPDVWSRIVAQIENDQYRIRASESVDRNDEGSYAALNPKQGYALIFDQPGISIQSHSTPQSPLVFTFLGWGYGDQLLPVESPFIHVENNTIEYRRGAITEWYVNRPEGVEQGFDIESPPARDKHSSLLRLAISMSDELSYRLTHAGSQLLVSDKQGNTLFKYQKLVVLDSNKQHIPAHMSLSGNRLFIDVDDRSAVYPITVDPLIVSAEKEFFGSYSSADNRFGISIAIDGDTLAVGAYQDEDEAGIHGTGSVYIYEKDRDGIDNWGLVKEIVAVDSLTDDQFGFAVALRGDLLAVGAPRHDPFGAYLDGGAVYLFDKTSGGVDNWGQIDKKTGSENDGYYGYSLAIDELGEKLVVGEPVRAGSQLSGRAYVYERDEGGIDNWGQSSQLLGSVQLINSEFGYAVSISNDSVLVGAPNGSSATINTNEGNAFLFERDQGGSGLWGLAATFIPLAYAPVLLTESRYGESVTISNDTLAIGFPGEDDLGGPVLSDRGLVEIRERNIGGPGAWGIRTSMTGASGLEEFGKSVSLINDVLMVAGPGEDHVLFYSRDHTGTDNWGLLHTQNSASNTGGFGTSVARSGNNVVIGDPLSSSSSGAIAGSVGIYKNTLGVISPVKDIQGDSGSNASGWFGFSVAIDADVLAIGAPTDNEQGSATGAVYLFGRHSGGTDNWGQLAKVFASDAVNDDFFGQNISLSGGTLVVGADQRQVSTVPPIRLGQVYIFDQDEGGIDNWGELQRITAPNSFSQFGAAVSVAGDTLVIGHPNDSTSLSNQGAVHIHYRNEGGIDNWGLLETIHPDTPVTLDKFGADLMLDQDTLAVSTNSGTDAVYIFGRNENGIDAWGQVRKITHPDPETFDAFGRAMSMAGDHLLVGAERHNQATTHDGEAYLFGRDEGGIENWGLLATLNSSFPLSSGAFGASVAITETIAAIGAPGEFNGLGSVHFYSKDQGGVDSWGHMLRLQTIETSENNLFGLALSSSNGKILVGSLAEGSDSTGKAFLYNFYDGVANTCSGTDPVISTTEYTAQSYCVASGSITAGGSPEVTVRSSGEVVYSAPIIILNPGFMVELGGQFSAGPNLPPPAAP